MQIPTVNVVVHPQKSFAVSAVKISTFNVLMIREKEMLAVKKIMCQNESGDVEKVICASCIFKKSQQITKVYSGKKY